MSYSVYNLAVYMLAAVYVGRCALRLMSVLTVCRYAKFKMK